jgi:hypothetical protein
MYAKNEACSGQLRCGVTDPPNGPIFFEFFVGVIPGKQGLIFNHQCCCSHLHVCYIEKLDTVRNGWTAYRSYRRPTNPGPYILSDTHITWCQPLLY